MSNPESNVYTLPVDCPVTALGVFEKYSFYRDAAGQNRMLFPDEHNRWGIFNLFLGNADLLKKLWPRLDENDQVVGWNHVRAAESLMAAASEAGILWHPEDLGFTIEREFIGRQTPWEVEPGD